MKVTTNIELSKKEINAYVSHILDEYPEANIETLDINVEGDEVELSYKLGEKPFERIRRITGYLVGTLDRFNPGKYAEVQDRVSHSLGDLETMEDIYIEDGCKKESVNATSKKENENAA